MKTFILAIKAFLRAFKDPKGAEKFILGEETVVSSDASHLRFLALMQKTGRLVDFLKEDIEQFSDAQIGAAARKIHAECRQCLEDFVTLRPLFLENEGSTITVPSGYSVKEIKVIGNVKGEPPYQGILRHKGWKAHKLSLPKQFAEGETGIVHAAEVEII